MKYYENKNPEVVRLRDFLWGVEGAAPYELI